MGALRCQLPAGASTAAEGQRLLHHGLEVEAAGEGAGEEAVLAKGAAMELLLPDPSTPHLAVEVEAEEAMLLLLPDPSTPLMQLPHLAAVCSVRRSKGAPEAAREAVAACRPPFHAQTHLSLDFRGKTRASNSCSCRANSRSVCLCVFRDM